MVAADDDDIDGLVWEDGNEEVEGDAKVRCPRSWPIVTTRAALTFNPALPPRALEVNVALKALESMCQGQPGTHFIIAMITMIKTICHRYGIDRP